MRLNIYESLQPELKQLWKRETNLPLMQQKLSHGLNWSLSMHQGSHRDSFYLVKQTDENNTYPLLFLSKITKTHEKQL